MWSGVIGFLVNRNQFTSSLFIDRVNQQEELPHCCQGTIMYGSKRLLLFDFESHLQKLFHFHDSSSADLALIIPSTVLTDEAQQRLAVMAESGIEHDFLALRIVNQSSIEQVDVSSLRAIPPAVRDAGNRGGIYGIRFIENNKVQYFIDVRTLMSPLLEGSI
jgi:hypothetical protein